MNEYSTHQTRSSDASRFDEVCVNCGATDAAGDNRLNTVCPNGYVATPWGLFDASNGTFKAT